MIAWYIKNEIKLVNIQQVQICKLTWVEYQFFSAWQNTLLVSQLIPQFQQ